MSEQSPAVGVSSSSSFPHSSSSISTISSGRYFFMLSSFISPFNTLSGRYSWRVREVLGFCSYSSLPQSPDIPRSPSSSSGSPMVGQVVYYFFFPFSALLLHSTWLATVFLSQTKMLTGLMTFLSSQGTDFRLKKPANFVQLKKLLLGIGILLKTALE